MLWLTSPSANATVITSVQANSDEIGRFKKFEVTFSLSADYDNPFDPDIVDALITFHEPDGSLSNVPAFFFRDYDVVGDDPEEYVNPGPPLWKARFAPSILGMHTFDITAVDTDGQTTLTGAGSFVCVDSNRRGFIRVDKRDPAFLCHDDGSSRVNIGHNVGWLSGGTTNWGNYFTSMGAVGENWTRIWMCPFGGGGGLILEYRKNHGSGYFEGLGRISMPVALRLDKVIELAEANGIAIQLVLQYHGAFSTSVNPNWDSNPYNSEHDGGFLTEPGQFFTNAEAQRITQNKYRYIVARWGYSPAILAWELWNEVQWTDGWKNDRSSVVVWHDEMGRYLRSVDPFGHLITTSSHQSGFDDIWNLEDIDLVQVHHYHGQTIPSFEGSARQFADLGKPVIMGEFGAGSADGVSNPEGYPEDLPEPYRTQMYEALNLHNGIWSAFHLKSSAHLWWWDNYIEKLDLYDEFRALAGYAAGEDLAAHNLSWAERVVSGVASIAATPGLSGFWDESVQTEFTLEDGAFPGIEHLSTWLHGSWKPEYRSDPIFHLSLPTDGYLIIHVERVSDYGPNGLRVLVNSVQAFRSGYPNGSSNFEIMVPLAAGSHSVQIENTGKDWFEISAYEFAPESVASLDSIGLVGNDRAYLWIYDTGSQLGQLAHGIFHSEIITVSGLANGSYDVQVYATRGAGGILQSDIVDSVDGRITYTLPDFSKDVAVKIRPACIVGFDDLAAFTSQWLLSGWGLTFDLTSDKQVDSIDFALLAESWLDSCPSGWPE
jgi:hypothetical protein